MSMGYDDWDHQRQYNINEIIEIRNYNLFDILVEMCVDMELHGNASAAEVYNNIINNPSNYPSLTDAAIYSMNIDGWVGATGFG